MNIVHIGPPHLPIMYKFGGAIERRIRELAVRQVAMGSRVVVYSAENRKHSSNYQGVEVRGLHCRRQGTIRAAEFLTKSLLDARTVQPDVIHFHSLPEGAAFAHLFCTGRGLRTILSYDYFIFRRGKENPFYGWYRRALDSFSSLLPVSDYCRRESAAYWTLPGNRMQVLYNGVNLQQFTPQSAAAQKRAELGLNGDFVVLYVGRICTQKGTDLLVEACARLRAEGRNVRLVLAGPIGQFGNDGSNEITSAAKAAQGLYLGAVDEEALPSIYSIADVFVMPTRANEMFGMATVEAQACGRPVICSDNGGLPEVVSSSGLLFRSGDAEHLAQQIRICMDHRELRQRLSAASIVNARRFAWDAITTRLDGLYREAAAL